MSGHHRHENDCLNCGAELQGPFCYVCGQENLHVKEPFWHFLGHSISHYFHFDSKFFETIIPLLTKPGQLTIDYLAGRRARYLHPVSMYIFVSIIYFLVVPKMENQSGSANDPVKINVNNDGKYVSIKAIEQAKTKLRDSKLDKADKIKAIKELDKTERKLKEKTFTGLPLIRQAAIVDSLKRAVKAHPADSTSEKLEQFTDMYYEKADTTSALYLTRQKMLPDSDRDDMFDKFMNVQRLDFKQKASKDWDFDKELEHYKPKLYFILMPLFAFFLMLIFRRNHKFYVEHIVFTIQFFTAFFIFEIVAVPIQHLVFNGGKWFDVVTLAAVGWYTYKALRLVYQRTPWVTIRKMVMLWIMYVIGFAISLGVISSIIYLSVYLS